MLFDANLWPVIGQDWAVSQLNRAFSSQRTRHAYLLTGPDSIGKTTLARAMAMTFNCTSDEVRPCRKCRSCQLISKDIHPDVSILEAERTGGTLKIDRIRELQRVLSMRPYEARNRIAIVRRFHEACRGAAAAANAFLKTLEEPPANVVIILTAEHASLLLPTITSRCQSLPLRPLRLQETVRALIDRFQEPEDSARMLAHLSGGRIGWAIRMLHDPHVLEQRNANIRLLEDAIFSNRRRQFAIAEELAKDKDHLFEILHLWLSYWRDALLIAHQNSAWITAIDRIDTLEQIAAKNSPDALQNALGATQRTLKYLQQNVNTRLALETLMLDYPHLSVK